MKLPHHRILCAKEERIGTITEQLVDKLVQKTK